MSSLNLTEVFPSESDPFVQFTYSRNFFIHSVGVFGQPVVKLKPRETLFRISETCSSCLKVNRLSSQADVVLSSQVDTTERFVLNYRSVYVLNFIV